MRAYFKHQLSSKTGRFMKISFFTILFLTTAIYLITTPNSIYRIEKNPSGKYTAIITHKTYLAWIPMPPGSSGDKPGYIEIFDQNEKSMGGMPLSMLQLAQIQWHEHGASIKLVGAWDFKRGTCYYWNKSGEHKIYSNQ